jgi:hypothetical protein
MPLHISCRVFSAWLNAMPFTFSVPQFFGMAKRHALHISVPQFFGMAKRHPLPISVPQAGVTGLKRLAD